MSKTPPDPPPGGGKSLEAFRAAHDKSYIIPVRIAKALAALGDSWEYEGEFMKRAGIAPCDISTFRDQFRDHWLEVKTSARNVKRVWAGTSKLAAKLRTVSG